MPFIGIVLAHFTSCFVPFIGIALAHFASCFVPFSLLSQSWLLKLPNMFDKGKARYTDTSLLGEAEFPNNVFFVTFAGQEKPHG